VEVDEKVVALAGEEGALLPTPLIAVTVKK
jgi:hypothetical protein